MNGGIHDFAVVARKGTLHRTYNESWNIFDPPSLIANILYILEGQV